MWKRPLQRKEVFPLPSLLLSTTATTTTTSSTSHGNVHWLGGCSCSIWIQKSLSAASSSASDDDGSRFHNKMDNVTTTTGTSTKRATTTTIQRTTTTTTKMIHQTTTRYDVHSFFTKTKHNHNNDNNHHHYFLFPSYNTTPIISNNTNNNKSTNYVRIGSDYDNHQHQQRCCFSSSSKSHIDDLISSFVTISYVEILNGGTSVHIEFNCEQQQSQQQQQQKQKNQNQDHSILCTTNNNNKKKNHSTCSIFHSPWLWVNQSSNVQELSGQKIHSTIMDYYRDQWTIQSATIINPMIPNITTSSPLSSSSSSSLPLVPPPPPGSLHPVGGIYDDDVASYQQGTNNNSNRQMLRILWKSNQPITKDSKWNSSNTNTTSIIESFYDIHWLYRCRYDPQDILQQRDQQTKIDSRNSIHSQSNLIRIKYNDLFSKKKNVPATTTTTTKQDILFQLLDAVIQNGAALVDNAPPTISSKDIPLQSEQQGTHSSQNDEDNHIHSNNAAVAVVGKLVSGGSLSHGHLYGDIFHVQNKMDANNIAYTSTALVPHQDLAYYESPPGYQLLHCINNRGVMGGQSILIDVIAAAEEFRQLAPTLFDILVQCTATFVKQRSGADMSYRRPHIEIYSSSSIPIVRSVRWSPPFEGPLCIQSDRVESYYMAYAAFTRMVDNSLPKTERFIPTIPWELEQQLIQYAHTHTWEYTLPMGSILIFNNQRMLHGRRAFHLKTTTPTINSNNQNQNENSNQKYYGRHLVGCYTNIDDTVNEYRLVRRRTQFQYITDPSFVRNVGNGSCGNI